ncbi:MAG: hypothetical protein R3F37_23820, partial [Candidatus Competibacteraceae bacterium]
FGGARVYAVSKPEQKLELWGIGAEQEGATWQPYHAREDLLWANIALPFHNPPPQPSHSEPQSQEAAERSNRPSQPSSTVPEELKSSYKFSPDRLFDFVGTLVRDGRMSTGAMRERLAIQSQETLRKYIRFLVSGQLIHEEGEQLQATSQLTELWQALSLGESRKTGEILRAVPSFNELWEFVASRGQVTRDDPNLPTVDSARSNYFALGEAVRAWVHVVDQGIVYTPFFPTCERFVDAAMSVYSEISRSDGIEWILTGKWLEKLAIEFGIHPVTARDQVERCRQTGVLRVFAEGSTPDNRFDTHSFWILSTRQEKPQLERAYFYRGNFLLPGTATVRIKLQPSDHAP